MIWDAASEWLRHRRLARVIPVVVLVAALIAAAFTAARADDLSDHREGLEEQIAAGEDALAGANQRLRRVASALETVRAQLPAVRENLQSVRGRLGSARAELAAVRQRLRQLDAEREKLAAAIQAARDQITRSEVLVGRIVRFQYQTSGFAEAAVILEAESPSDFVQRVMATESVTDAQAAIIDQLTTSEALLVAREQEYEVTEQAISVAKVEAQEQVGRLSELRSSAKDAAQRLRTLVATRRQALEVARAQRDAELTRLRSLESAKQQLDAQIAQSGSTGTGKVSGRLRWPLPGMSAGQGVGWRTHPIYGYRSCHTGVDVGAASGTPIVAAADGIVVWTRSELSGPWGNNTLVDHGNGLSTFYPHQSGFNVSPGQRVRAGDVIGYVGSTGYATGPHLHFEVHINGVPFDPMGWFGGQRRSQSQFCP